MSLLINYYCWIDSYHKILPIQCGRMPLLKSLIPRCFGKLPRLPSSVKESSSHNRLLICCGHTLQKLVLLTSSCSCPLCRLQQNQLAHTTIKILPTLRGHTQQQMSMQRPFSTMFSSKSVLKRKAHLRMQHSFSSTNGICGKRRKIRIPVCQQNSWIEATSFHLRRAKGIQAPG